jgi:biopolymer transport protein ExbD
MAMSTNNTTGQVMVDMNTTPLIDVMLVLLVLLIVTLPIQTHAVKIGMPANVPPTKPPPVETVELAVDFDGAISWNGVHVSRATMDSYLADAARKNPQPEIHVTPDRLARYDAVASVLADAQRLGATQIGFSGIDQYR